MTGVQRRSAGSSYPNLRTTYFARQIPFFFFLNSIDMRLGSNPLVLSFVLCLNRRTITIVFCAPEDLGQLLLISISTPSPLYNFCLFSFHFTPVLPHLFPFRSVPDSITHLHSFVLPQPPIAKTPGKYIYLGFLFCTRIHSLCCVLPPLLYALKATPTLPVITLISPFGSARTPRLHPTGRAGHLTWSLRLHSTPFTYPSSRVRIPQ